MAIHRTDEDPFIKEMQKWEHRPVLLGGKGGTYIEPIPWKADGTGGKGDAPHQEYPKWLHKPGLVDGAPAIVSSKLVRDESEELIAKGQGWYVDQAEAVKDFHHELATLAANRAASDRRMSAAAQAEAARVDEASMAHLPVIPEAKQRKGTA